MLHMIPFIDNYMLKHKVTAMTAPFSEPVTNLKDLYEKVGHQGDDLIYKWVTWLLHHFIVIKRSDMVQYCRGANKDKESFGLPSVVYSTKCQYCTGMCIHLCLLLNCPSGGKWLLYTVALWPWPSGYDKYKNLKKHGTHHKCNFGSFVTHDLSVLSHLKIISNYQSYINNVCCNRKAQEVF